MIRKYQLTAYDAAASKCEEAAKALEAINLARISTAHAQDIEAVILTVRKLRAELFHLAYAAFLAERGLK